MNLPKKAVAAGSSTTLGGVIAALIVAKWWPDADAATVLALTALANGVITAVSAYLPKMEEK